MNCPHGYPITGHCPVCPLDDRASGAVHAVVADTVTVRRDVYDKLVQALRAHDEAWRRFTEMRALVKSDSDKDFDRIGQADYAWRAARDKANELRTKALAKIEAAGGKS